MRTKRLSRVFFILAGGLLLAPPVLGASYDYAAHSKAAETKYQRPEDLLDKIPFLSDIPRTFLIGDGFKMDLSLDQLRIDHMGSHSRSPVSRRSCLFGLSYTTPVAGFFTSRVDVPLLAASHFRWSEWKPCSLGDYVAFFSRGASESSSFRLVLSAKF